MAERGYGSKYKQDRKTWALQVSLGIVACRRCGKLIAAGSPWDLGHDDHDRSLPTQPEHRACNRATAGRRRTSREW